MLIVRADGAILYVNRPLGRRGEEDIIGTQFYDWVFPDQHQAVREALETFRRLGATLVEVSLPHTEYAVATYYIVATAEASTNLARYDGVRYGYRAEGASGLIDMMSRTRAEGFGPEVKRRIMIGTYALSAGYYEAYYGKAQKVRTLIRRDFEAWCATTAWRILAAAPACITGQDGSYLAELLLDKGYEVHGIKRRASLFNTQRIDHLYRDPHEGPTPFVLHHGDLTDSSNLIRLVQQVQPDEIYNLAAQSHVAVSFEQPEYTADTDGIDGNAEVHVLAAERDGTPAPSPTRAARSRSPITASTASPRAA